MTSLYTLLHSLKDGATVYAYIDRYFAEARIAENTKRSYKTPLIRFFSWCKETNRDVWTIFDGKEISLFSQQCPKKHPRVGAICQIAMYIEELKRKDAAEGLLALSKAPRKSI